MKDTKDAPKRGRIEPPAHLKGPELVKWLREEDEKRKAEAQALKAQMISQATVQHWTPVSMPTEAKAAPQDAGKDASQAESQAPLSRAKDVATQQAVQVLFRKEKSTPIPGPSVADIPLQSPNGLGDSPEALKEKIRKIQGRRPKTEEELLAKIENLFAVEVMEADEHRLEFESVRMVYGFYIVNQKKVFEDEEVAHQKGLDFCTKNLEGFISIDLFIADWDLVKIPCWLLEGLFLAIPQSWDHPALKHPRIAQTRIRQLAGVSFYLQKYWGKDWFLMDQNEVAEVIDRTQQEVSKCLGKLCRDGWLEKGKASRGRSNEYRCPAAIQAYFGNPGDA